MKKIISIILPIFLLISFCSTSVLAIEQGDDTALWIVAGDAPFFNGDWNPENTANKLSLDKDGFYSKTYENAEAGAYEFKVTNGSWNESYGDGKENFKFIIKEACDVIIRFNAENKKVYVFGDNVELGEPSEFESPGYYITGSEGLCGKEWAQEDLNTKMTVYQKDETSEPVIYKDFANIAKGTYEFKIYYINDKFKKWWRANEKTFTVTVEQNNSSVRIVFNPAMIEEEEDTVDIYVTAPGSGSVSQSPLLDVAEAVPKDTETKTLRFYMPEEWRNSYNDSYDGENLSSCSAGIYWWDSSYSPKEVYDETKSDWPGYSIHETEPADSNIFVAKVPSDISTVIFNNTVDGGNRDDDVDRYNAAFQTVNVNAKHYLPDEDGYGFYVDGTEDCNEMIFVCEKEPIDDYDLLINHTYKGAWFYYYGNGKYGYYKTLEEAEQNKAVYSGGEWPLIEKPTEPQELPDKDEETYEYADNQVIVAFTDYATDLIYSGKLDLEKYFAEKNLGIEKFEKADYKSVEYFTTDFYILTLNKSDKDNVIEVCDALETDENVMFASTIALDNTITNELGYTFADNQLMVSFSPEEYEKLSGNVEKYLKGLNLGITKVTPVEDYTYTWDEMNPSPFDIYTYYISLDKHNCVNALNVEKILSSCQEVYDVTEVSFIQQEPDDSKKTDIDKVYVIFTEEFTKKIIEGSVNPEEYIASLNLGINKVEYFVSFGKRQYWYLLYLETPTPENSKVVYHTLKTLPEVYKAGIFDGSKAVDDSPATQPTTVEPTTAAPAITPNKDVKKANPMKVTAKTKTVKAKKLKKGKLSVKAITVKNAEGKVSFKKLSGSKKLTVTKKGKITIKKGTKKGTYRIKVKITAKGNSKYSAKSVTKTVKVKVK